MKVTTRRKRDKRVIVGVVVFGLLVVLALAGLFVVNNLASKKEPAQPTQPVQEEQKPVVEQDPELLAMAGELGIDVSGVNLRYGEPEHLTLTGTTIGTYKHKPDVTNVKNSVGNVTVKPDSDDKIRTLAHEYMHHVWDKYVFFVNYGEEKRHDLEKLLDVALVGSAKMQERLNWYIEDVPDFDRYTELQSFACAETNPSELPQQLNDWCNKWIPNRERVLWN